MSKIQFKSKSQPGSVVANDQDCCYSICQRYNLKANHNYKGDMTKIKDVVIQYVKDTI